MFSKPPFGVDGGLTPHSRGGDGLAIVGIGDIAASEYAGDIGMA